MLTISDHDIHIRLVQWILGTVPRYMMATPPPAWPERLKRAILESAKLKSLGVNPTDEQWNAAYLAALDML